MSLPVSPAKDALGNQILRLSELVFLDIVGDPVRATTHPTPLTFVGNPDADLNGTFDAINSDVVDIGGIEHTIENSSTLTITLSGLSPNNDDLLAVVNDRSLWAGREAIIWHMVADEAAQQIGQPWRHYTGRVTQMTSMSKNDSGVILLSIENYLASLSEPSNRSYMSQSVYDSGDRSAEASLAAANSRNPLSTGTGGYSGGGGGGGRNGGFDGGGVLNAY